MNCAQLSHYKLLLQSYPDKEKSNPGKWNSQPLAGSELPEAEAGSVSFGSGHSADNCELSFCRRSRVVVSTCKSRKTTTLGSLRPTSHSILATLAPLVHFKVPSVQHRRVQHFADRCPLALRATRGQKEQDIGSLKKCSETETRSGFLDSLTPLSQAQRGQGTQALRRGSAHAVPSASPPCMPRCMQKLTVSSVGTS